MPCCCVTPLPVMAASLSSPLLTGSPGWSAALWRCRRQRGCVPAARWWPGAAPQAGWAAVGGGRCRAKRSARPGAVRGRDGAVTTAASCAQHPWVDACSPTTPGWHPQLPTSLPAHPGQSPKHPLPGRMRSLPSAGIPALSPSPHLSGWLIVVLPYLKGKATAQHPGAHLPWEAGCERRAPGTRHSTVAPIHAAASPHCSQFTVRRGWAGSHSHKGLLTALTRLNFHLLQELPQG